MIYVLDLFGVAVFAVTGALAAGKKQMDLFGVVVLALATALGGGTLRDLILGAYPVFWISDPTYIFVGTAAAILIFVLARFFRPPAKALKFADAFGLAVFTVIGTSKAISLGVPGSISVIMGVLTGVAGGIIRDMLSGEIPLVLKAEIYATASLCGAITFVVLTNYFSTPWKCPAASCDHDSGTGPQAGRDPLEPFTSRIFPSDKNEGLIDSISGERYVPEDEQK